MFFCPECDYQADGAGRCPQCNLSLVPGADEPTEDDALPQENPEKEDDKENDADGTQESDSNE